MPTTDVPRSERGWLDLLSQTLSEILNIIGRGVSCLFNALWPLVVSAWKTSKNFVMAHPKIAIAIAILVLSVLLAHPLAKVVTGILGFGVGGIQAGSIAAQLQSILYGGFVPAGSIFSFFQSFGAI